MIVASGDSLIIPAVPDLIWGTVAFLIVALVVGKLAWPTFMNMLDERGRKIDEGLNAAAHAEEEIARERAALAEEVDEARREATRIREQAQTNAGQIVDDAKKQATLEAARITENAQRQIDADIKIAQSQLRRDVGSLATELAERIVGQQALDPTISGNVIDSFLDELEAGNTVLAKEN